MVSERPRYTKVSQSSGRPVNGELMSRSKFTRDIGGSANKDILGKNSQRASEGGALAILLSPKRTNRAQEAGKPQSGRGRGASGERGRSRTGDGIAPRVSWGGLSCPPANVKWNWPFFPLTSVCETRAKRPFLPRSSRLLPPSYAAAASSVLKLPPTTEGECELLARGRDRHLGGKEG